MVHVVHPRLARQTGEARARPEKPASRRSAAAATTSGPEPVCAKALPRGRCRARSPRRLRHLPRGPRAGQPSAGSPRATWPEVDLSAGAPGPEPRRGGESESATRTGARARPARRAAADEGRPGDAPPTSAAADTAKTPTRPDGGATRRRERADARPGETPPRPVSRACGEASAADGPCHTQSAPRRRLPRELRDRGAVARPAAEPPEAGTDPVRPSAAWRAVARTPRVRSLRRPPGSAGRRVGPGAARAPRRAGARRAAPAGAATAPGRRAIRTGPTPWGRSRRSRRGPCARGPWPRRGCRCRSTRFRASRPASAGSRRRRGSRPR